MSYPQGGNGWQQMPPPNMAPQPFPGQPYGPGYYPPPPKKKKTWLWVLLAIVTVIVVGIGGILAFVYYDSSRVVTVTYEVAGTDGSATVMYSQGEFGNLTTEEGVALPWRKDVELAPDAAKAFQLTVQPEPGGSAECKVTLNGEVIKQDKSQEPGRNAHCFGTAA
ncbi:hypothetical protein FR943_18490 [Mycobacterium sp. TNTM28]|uniref:Mycobacterium membrane protein n=1 Tax=[Mycobacterium] fortunisiensis TaxID=2600579 RepID=A0ABS6KQB6_9MYCO|nr:MmpS family transport accessory protein [[Mycobacterium] fortunisiensis]MBU9765822.1 hypothetical protein [[Mycobacterium] fortunisiensis]